jgi:DNA ligase-1
LRKRSGQSIESCAKSPPKKVKVEEPEEDLEEDEEEVAPVTKRQRRHRNRIEEDDDEDDVMPDAEPVKPKQKTIPSPKKPSKKSSITAFTSKKKPAPKVEEEEEDEDEVMADAEPVKPKQKTIPSSKKSAKSSTAASVSKKRTAPKVEEEEDEVADEAASESVSEAEKDEDEDDDPEVAAKARKMIQTKLEAKAKDPYPDWTAGTPVPYAALCTTFSLVELTTKRLIITEHCALFLRQVLRLTPEDFLSTVLLMINKLAPDYAGIELGIGESLIMKAIGETTGRSLQVIKADQKEIGDLGLVAVKSRSTQPTMFKPKPLTIRGVHKGLMDVATVAGNGAQGRKVDLIKKLLSSADSHSTGKVDISKDKGGPSEAKFIVRFLEGKLRLGLAERTVLVSIAQAVISHEMEQKGKIPSTTQMEEAEALLKSVYRYDTPHDCPLNFKLLS